MGSFCSSHQAVGNTELLEEKGLDYEKKGSQRTMLRQLMLKHAGMRRMFDRECAECSIRRYIGRCSVNS